MAAFCIMYPKKLHRNLSSPPSIIVQDCGNKFIVDRVTYEKVIAIWETENQWHFDGHNEKCPGAK